ncbi:lysophospholipid acyltransferase family protein [Candidatus Chloroploca asiatica]|uniref:Phospholipid/glycerol acyltransferase domain-containing protein n=1 Tax=Candidatus Chloroploca asiatica TaxID=1506545 RepID=A0A2H3KVA3_9CHLR|nr:lysophospholipid acyltransferase family protein [Candidatus Chloroploca asiatica]PDV97814.1 hypothetical protein A9Q02_17350 [Candidatus Chloroploca asiatica]
MNDAPLPRFPAAKNWLGDELLYWFFARWSLWSSFDRVWLQSHGPLPDPDDGPLILYLNHSAWWDGYLMYIIHRIVLQGRFDAHLLMEEKQLRAYRFFTWSGAFGLDRGNPAETERTLAYTVKLLRERKGSQARSVFIFPQGRIVPQDQRPLVMYPGVARIITQLNGDVNLCPVALRYEFSGEQRPHAFIRIGPVHRADAADSARATMRDLNKRLTQACDALRDDVVGEQRNRFAVILRGQRGIDQQFDRFRKLFRRTRR